MNKIVVQIPGIAKPPSPFNHVVRAGDFLFLSSQLAVDLQQHKILGGTIAEQTRQAIENIRFLLKSAGSSLDQVVKIVVYLKDVKRDFEAMNTVYQEYFKPESAPARVTIQALSPLDQIDIEIEATALA